MNPLLDFLAIDYVALFIIIGIGILIGRVEIKGISLDSSAVIFVAMAYGHFLNYQDVEISLPDIIQQTGLLLFIFTIGMQAGPSFYEVLKSQGSKFILLALLVVLSGSATTAILATIFEIKMPIAVGLFTGALTSTPGLAAAIDASGSDIASIGYGIAYPFGVIGVVLFVKLAPKIFRISVEAEEEKYLAESNVNMPKVTNQNYIVTRDEVSGKTLSELDVRGKTGANISRIMRSDEEAVPLAADAVIQKGDLLKAVGTEEALKELEALIGEATEKKIPESGMSEVRWYVISRSHVVNKALGELDLQQNFKATATRIRRSGVDLPASPSLRLRFGDRLLVSSTRGNVDALSNLFGDSMKEVETTSFLPVALGIVIGLLIGNIEIPIPGSTSFSLGRTGGVLIAALVLSRLGKTGPLIWSLPGTGNLILRQFGLLLFLTPVGLSAGTRIGEALQDHGFSLFGIAAVITLVPLILVTLIGRFMMKINFLSLLGTLTGGMTSTPGLSAVDSLTETGGPQVAYAAVYPFALVGVIILTQILSYLL